MNLSDTIYSVLEVILRNHIISLTNVDTAPKTLLQTPNILLTKVLPEMDRIENVSLTYVQHRPADADHHRARTQRISLQWFQGFVSATCSYCCYYLISSLSVLNCGPF